MTPTDTAPPPNQFTRFTDSLGREWTVGPITVGHLKPLRAAGFPIDKIAEAGPTLGTLLFGDPIRLATAAHILVGGDRADCPLEDFEKGLDGRTLEAAGEAILEAVCAFFNRSKVARHMGGRVKRMLAEIDDKTIAALEKKLPAGNPPA